MVAPVDLRMVDWWLDLWAAWMRDGIGTRGFPGKTPGMMGSRGLACAEWSENTRDDEDRHKAGVMDTCIGELTPNHRLAVENAHGICVTQFKSKEIEATFLAEAKQLLGLAMRRRGFPA